MKIITRILHLILDIIALLFNSIGKITGKTIQRVEHLHYEKLRSYFFSGLMIVLPLAATIWILLMLIGLLANPIASPLHAIYGPRVPFFLIEVFSLFFSLVIIVGIGVLGQDIAGKLVIRRVEEAAKTIPIVKDIYNTFKQIIDSFSLSQKTSFQRMVMVEFPRQGLWMMGLVTNNNPKVMVDISGNKLTEEMITVFVPTVPNPTTGFFFFCKKSEVRELDISIEDGLKMIISAGVLTNDNEKPLKEQTPDSMG